MTEIIVYEMKFTDKVLCLPKVKLVPFLEKYYLEYEKIYNKCFYDMRKALDIKPYDFYSNINQLKDKMDNIYLLLEDDIIIGSIACIENEIDDVIVNKKYQNRGIGNQVLLWGVQHIREKNDMPITLHVAKWNERALSLYKKNGFVVVRSEKIR